MREMLTGCASAKDGDLSCGHAVALYGEGNEIEKAVCTSVKPSGSVSALLYSWAILQDASDGRARVGRVYAAVRPRSAAHSPYYSFPDRPGRSIRTYGVNELVVRVVAVSPIGRAPLT